MNLQVQSLKVLATREVVTKRLDYSNHLNGTTKDELDRLGRLAGHFKIHDSEITIDALRDGEKGIFVKTRGQVFDKEDLKKCFGNDLFSDDLINIIEGNEGFSIAESKNGPRNWVITDTDGWKRDLLVQRGALTQYSGRWIHCDDFIEDGNLVSHKNVYQMYNGTISTILSIRDSITADKHGYVTRKLTWTQVSNLPRTDFKITKVMQARKVLENEEEEVVPPHCQPNHRSFPPIEELQDKKYWAKLQTINAAINDPHRDQDQLDQIVDLILDTGNFSTSSGSFNFDICNLEKSVVLQIAEVLGV